MSDPTVVIPNRRQILRAMLASATAVAAGATAFELAAPPLRAQSKLTPDAAAKQLVDGNQRFAANQLTSIQQDLEVLKSRTAEKQEPFAAVLACADSRVPVELIFDQTIGHLFVARVAGNVATPDMIASLEYGAAVLGTKAILVLAHANCGAIKATIEGKAVPGQISQLYAPIRPAVEAAGSDVNAVGKANAKIQAHLLATASPLLAGLIKEAKLKIVAGFYDLGTGKVSILT